MRLQNRLRATGTIRFLTPVHIGSGTQGSAASNLGVMLDAESRPVIPGSTLKGVFRSTAESLAEHLGLTVCYLDRRGNCPGGNEERAKASLKDLEHRDADVESVLGGLCGVCRLFGSPLARGRVRFRDSRVETWTRHLEIRDGVAIDRDSHTAAVGAKYDYEVVPALATFAFGFEGDNLSPIERALLLVVIHEWARGFRLGGMTSRGLGHAELVDTAIEEVDFCDPQQRIAYLLDGTMARLTPEVVQRHIKLALPRG